MIEAIVFFVILSFCVLVLLSDFLRKPPARTTVDAKSGTETHSVVTSFIVKTPEPEGRKIQVLRTITKRTWGQRIVKLKIGSYEQKVAVPWPEVKTWPDWQTLELVTVRKRSVVVRYPDGSEVVVKTSRTRPCR